jgi:hypothetical protein
MMGAGDELRVAEAPERNRYEVLLGDEVVGIAEYVTLGSRRVFTHTQVDRGLEGRGVGSALVRGALDDVRARGLVASNRCPFIRTFLERHPDYADVFAPSTDDR